MIDMILSQARKPTGSFGIGMALSMGMTHREYYNAVCSLIDIKIGMRVLDIGCGLSDIGADLVAEGVKYIGIDHSSDVIETASKAWPEVTFVCGDISEIEIPIVDAAICVNVIQWLRDPLRVFNKIRRALVGGGKFIVGTPDRDCPRSSFPDGVRCYSSDGLRGLFELGLFRNIGVHVREMTHMRYLIGEGVV